MGLESSPFGHVGLSPLSRSCALKQLFSSPNRKRSSVFTITYDSEEAVARTMLIDGALGTELERIGCDLSGKLWSGKVLRENPEQIARVHEAYLEAGADCITTAS